MRRSSTEMRPVCATVTLAAAFGLLLACAKTPTTALTPEGARVRVSESGAVGSCEYIGDFVGGGGFLTKPNMSGWWETNQVRNLAAQRGATDVVIGTQTNGHVVGRGYRCL